MADNGAVTQHDRMLLAELGTVGLKAYSGIVSEEYVRDLTGLHGVRTFGRMANDDVVGALLFANEMLCRQAPWSVVPASEDQRARDHAALLEGMLFRDMSQSWTMFLSEALSCQIYGWSYHEIVWKRRLGESPPPGYVPDDLAWAWWAPSQYDDGLLGFRKFPLRAQETLLRWDMDAGGGIRGMVQQDPLARTLVTIPMSKALLFRIFAHKGNPEGRSLLRSAYESWYYKKHIRRIEGIGIERDLAGLFHARIPVQYMLADAAPGEKAIFDYIKKMGRSIHRDEQECLVTPLVYDDRNNELFKFELMSTGGARQFDTSAIIHRYDTRILQTVLANVLMIGLMQVGTQALAEELGALYTMGLTAILESIAEVINRHAIPRLWQLNALPRETMPSLRPGRIRQVDFEKFTAGILRLAQAGMILYPQDEAHIRAEIGFPAPVDVEPA